LEKQQQLQNKVNKDSTCSLKNKIILILNWSSVYCHMVCKSSNKITV